MNILRRDLHLPIRGNIRPYVDPLRAHRQAITSYYAHATLKSVTFARCLLNMINCRCTNLSFARAYMKPTQAQSRGNRSIPLGGTMTHHVENCTFVFSKPKHEKSSTPNTSEDPGHAKPVNCLRLCMAAPAFVVSGSRSRFTSLHLSVDNSLHQRECASKGLCSRGRRAILLVHSRACCKLRLVSY